MSALRTPSIARGEPDLEAARRMPSLPAGRATSRENIGHVFHRAGLFATREEQSPPPELASLRKLEPRPSTLPTFFPASFQHFNVFTLQPSNTFTSRC
jgi:hypothetical protein